MKERKIHGLTLEQRRKVAIVVLAEIDAVQQAAAVQAASVQMWTTQATGLLPINVIAGGTS